MRHKALVRCTQLISFPGKNILDNSKRVAAKNIQVAGDITDYGQVLDINHTADRMKLSNETVVQGFAKTCGWMIDTKHFLFYH